MVRPPRPAPRPQQGVVESLNACTVALKHLSSARGSQPIRTSLSIVADASWQYLEKHSGDFERMMDTLHTTPIPRVDGRNKTVVW